MYNDPLLYCSLKVKRFDTKNYFIVIAILTCRTHWLSLPRPIHPSLTINSVIIIIFLIIIIIIIIIIIFSSFLQCIYTYIPETNHVPREYIVAAILSLPFMVPMSPVPALALLYFYISTFRSMCAVPNMAVFCSSLTSWFPGMLLLLLLLLLQN
jgi:hypothetical protein